MYADSVQEFFTYSGYYLNEFSRESIRTVEEVTRPSTGDWKETASKAYKIATLFLKIPLALLFFFPSALCYLFAAALGKGRFVKQEGDINSKELSKRSLRVMSLNTCFQDPWSPLTGGVVTPFEQIDSLSRIAHLANEIGKRNLDVVLCQEVENLGAQKEFIENLKEKGFKHFIYDIGASEPIQNGSGLFAASKYPILEEQFTPYPLKDRAGLSKWSSQGALSLKIETVKGKLQFINIHLNYYSKLLEHQAERNRQLKNHILPLTKNIPSVITGDANFDTECVDPKEWGGENLINEVAGKVTCTDKGKHFLRGKSLVPEGALCIDCEEKLDVVICDKTQVKISEISIEFLKQGSHFLTDHAAITFTAEIA